MLVSDTEQLGPIEWWVWLKRDVTLKSSVVVTAETRLAALRQGSTRLHSKSGTPGLADLDAEVRREGDSRANRIVRAA